MEKAAFSIDASGVKVALRDSEHDVMEATTTYGGSGGSFSSRFPSQYERNVTPPEPPQSTYGDVVKRVGLIVIFVLIRSVHPLIVSQTRVGGKYVHEPISVPLVECVFSWVVAQGMALGNGGGKLWLGIWDRRPLSIFSMIGVVYAISDYLEIKSLGSISGPVYQVLCQSKLVVTAGLLQAIKGQRQTSLQWILLMMLTLSSCCYSIMSQLLTQHRILKSGGTLEDMGGGSGSAFGMAMVAMKVTVSCLCSVLADKHMKDYKSEPIYVQIAQFKASWSLTLFALVALEGGFANGPAALFHDWRSITCVSVLSFAAKNWSGMYLLALLDSMTKGIGDAMSVLLSYFIAVFHYSFDDEYESETFIAVVVVILCIAAYMTSKDVVAKAAKFDEQQRQDSQRTLQVIV